MINVGKVKITEKLINRKETHFMTSGRCRTKKLCEGPEEKLSSPSCISDLCSIKIILGFVLY